ncbi:hypothetical protein ACFL17_03115 [Pseudomonadota bacterium]
MIDENNTTVGEMSPLRTRNKRIWHAFGHSEQEFNRLWFRAVREKRPELRLIKLGQFFHFLQDWEAHADYPVGLGHAFATITGADPDSLAKDRTRTNRMLQSTLVHLGKMCLVMDRHPNGIQDEDTGLLKMLEGTRAVELLSNMILTSSPGWRKPGGSLSKKGRDIIAKNKLRIEKIINRIYRTQLEKKVPSDFLPGDDNHGIPSPLGLRYDREGNLTESLDRVIKLAHEVRSKDIDPADDGIDLQQAKRVKGGWQVRVAFKNHGDIASQAGDLIVSVIDGSNADLLGELVFKVPRLQAGQKYVVPLMVPTLRVAEEEIISVDLHVDDLSLGNNRLWFITEQDATELREDYKGQGRASDGRLLDALVKSVEFVGSPKLWLTQDKWLLSTITVRTNLNDPTEELAPPVVRLPNGGQVMFHDPSVVQQVWSISVMGENQRPAAKSMYDIKVSEYCQKANLEEATPRLEYVITSGQVQVRKTVDLDTKLIKKLNSLCSR